MHYVLPIFVLSIIGRVLDSLLHAHQSINILIALAVFIPSFAGPVKRLHDRNHSGWLGLLAFVPIIGWIWYFIEAGCMRGTQGANRFGEDPINPIIYPNFSAGRA